MAQRVTSSEIRAGGRGLPTRAMYRAIKLVIFDVDGVLTDGRIVLDGNGVESKFFNVRDGSGMTFLHKAGLKQALLTGRSSPVVDVRARELKIEPSMVKQGARFKLPVFTELLAACGVQKEEAVYVGDDLIDLPVLEAAGIACCPIDAHADVFKACHLVAQKPGGQGAVRVLCEQLLKARGDGLWEKAMAAYLGRV